MRHSTQLVFSLLAATSPLCNAAEIEPLTCRNGFFPARQDALELAEFKGAKDQKLFFYRDTESCPAERADCKKGAFVIPGDEIIINQRAGQWGCAWYHGKNHETVGWVKTDQLTTLPPDTDSLEAWAGTWTFYKRSHLTFSIKGKSLVVKGKAIWDGGGGNIHGGYIFGRTTPDQRHASFTQGEGPDACKVEFTRLGRTLIVHDNLHCGDINVTFDGVYKKTK